MTRLRRSSARSFRGQREARGLLATCLLAAAACTPSIPTASPVSSAGPTPTAGHPSPSSASEPGRPYAAQDLLAAMRESRRPGGVAEELQTDAVAAQVADQLWTWDGSQWTALAVSGSCGNEACTLEVVGSAEGGAGADTYTFSVDRASEEVQLQASDLHGYPVDLADRLDALARGELSAARLEGMALLGARWLPPPDAGRYWLSYRTGGEEGSPGLDVLVDLPAGTVIESREPG